MAEISVGVTGKAAGSGASLNIVSHPPGDQPRFVCMIKEEFLSATEPQGTTDFQTSVSCLLKSHWQKHVIWPNPESV